MAKTTNKKETKSKLKKEQNLKKTTKGKEVMKRIETNASQESKKMIIILAVLIVILVIFYLIAAIVTGKIDLNKNEEPEIQYSEILAGSTFKQNDTEYVVLYYDFTNENASDYTSLVSTFTNNESNPTLYTVDLSRKFNSAYIKTDEESVNKNPTKATDLKLTNPTLIKIKDQKVIDYIEGYDQIKNYMS